MLSPLQQDTYRRDGFLVLERFASPEACDALMARAAELVAAFDPAETRSVFQTRDQKRTSDAYFMGSGDQIRFFLEEEAVDADGRLARPKEASINKIGHAMHDLDPVFERFSRTPELASVVRDLGVRDPGLLQSMYIFKQPGIGGEVTCHQDATFLYTDPISVVGLWFALEDATLDNGCLQAIPGGHAVGLKSRFRRDDAVGVRTEVLDASPWPLEALVPLEVPRGTLVVLHGLLPHMSRANRSPRSRHAYSIHVIDRSSVYPSDNWLHRRPELPLRGFDATPA